MRWNTLSLNARNALLSLQSIIEEEGGLNNNNTSGKSGGADSARDSEDNGHGGSSGTADGADQSNWDQPLIVAEPDVKVSRWCDDLHCIIV